jgi:hypothetical protein
MQNRITPEDVLKEILRSLDVLVSIQLDNPPPERPTAVNSKIYRLTDLGLRPSEAAKILGVPVQRVTSALAKRPRKKR